ncbi:urease accessory protein UreF [Rhodoferax sp.]|uniref:urease accessory protein UreF n=1 Tax=Rhodoferax sp. TaxID=50421 RepID=UPI00374D0DB3
MTVRRVRPLTAPVRRRPARSIGPAPQAQESATPSLLQLIWLASPALPVGGFSYSEGLEAAVDRAGVATESRASDWLVDQLHITLTRGDLAAIAKAIPAWRRGAIDTVAELNAWILQTRETSEFRAQAEQMGRSLLDWLRNHNTASTDDIAACARMQPTYPIAYALAAAATQAPLRDCLLAYAFGWAENMTQSAIKSVPLGQSAGQRILARLAADIPAAVDHAIQLLDSQRQAFSPMLAILSSQHEVQYSRLFRS